MLAPPRAGPAGRAGPVAPVGMPVWMIGMNYELFMGEALAEATSPSSRGERPIAAVAVVNDAMVARPTTACRKPTTPPPTPWSSRCAKRPASSAPRRFEDATIFATLEPCAMCVGALLESDVEALVFACPNEIDGAAGTVLQLAQHTCPVGSGS